MAPGEGGCIHRGHAERRHPWAAAVARKVAGYLLEAATLFPLFRMTMADGARPTWAASWGIVGALVGVAAGLYWFGQRAGLPSGH